MNQVDELLLEHFGKKGMHWGQRTSAANRAANKAKNKASRAKDKQEFVSTVEKARANIKSGKTKDELQKAKNAHAANKAELGSREARKILNKAKDKAYTESFTAQQAKNGKEVTQVLLTSVAAGVAAYAISRAITKGSRF